MSISLRVNLRYNGTYRPAAIGYVNSAKQVSEVVKIGHESDLGYNVVARSGGHSYIAGGLGGKNGSIVIDLYSLAILDYEVAPAIAHMGTGFKLGTIAGSLDDWGRALPHGTCAYVGWGGHISYGGYGFTTRNWGLTLDTMISAQIVLANGTIATASQDQNPDLFFAIRGAAPSFGIVTQTTVQTLPKLSSATVYQYGWNLNVAAATSALDVYQQYSLTATIPKELGIEVVLAPGDTRGTVSFMVLGAWYGAANTFNATIKPLLDKLPKPLWTTFDVGDYRNSLKNLAGGSIDTFEPNGHDTFYANCKSLITPKNAPLTAQAERAFITYLTNQGFDTDLGWFLQIGLIGDKNSAVAAVPAGETAFPHRNALFIWQLYGYTQGNKPPFPSSGFTFIGGIADSVVKSMAAGWDYGAYTNYIDDRLQDGQQLYYKQNLPRLKELKKKYDPTRVFDFPTAIKP
ncbi:glucooligosaccharide oxidase [Coprinellus micaceus]|uniref:Glucooligosaccharide oxidase n=1 Tax=Coprinellus micaceus TaxID=71717 RepID=A0A4Y7SY77_COPMI|nr:glucooligosaccharide oxidase [Coprinellus micaceus]